MESADKLLPSASDLFSCAVYPFAMDKTPSNGSRRSKGTESRSAFSTSPTYLLALAPQGKRMLP
jgi:hypothetical protein